MEETITIPDYSSPKETEALDERYRYHAPSNDQLPRYQELRTMAHRLALTIDKHCPPSREKSTAQTMLQQAVQSANAAIAITEVKRERPAEPGDAAPARV